MRFICALLLRCNYGHVPYEMVSEIWQMVQVDLERTGTLDEDGLMVCSRCVPKSKPETRNAKLNRS